MGSLSGALPTCTGSHCASGVPAGLGYNSAGCDGKRTGETCTVGCAAGYDMSGSVDSRCQANGVFTAIGLICVPKSCGNLKSISNFGAVAVQDNCQYQVYGKVCLAYCASGYRLLGLPTLLFCYGDEINRTAGFLDLSAASFSNPAPPLPVAPTCAGIECLYGIPNIRGADNNCVGKVTTETCAVSAQYGFIATGGATKLTCGASGQFAGPLPSIQPATCSSPTFGAGVASQCVGKTFGTTCWAYCQASFAGGAKEYKCGLVSGSVSIVPIGANITCAAKTRRLQSFQEGSLDLRRLAGGAACTAASVLAAGLNDPRFTSDCDGKADGEVCLVACADGYNLIDISPAIQTCVSGSLTGVRPTCVPIPCAFAAPSGLGVMSNCAGIGTGGNCSATCGGGYSLSSGTGPSRYTCGAGGRTGGSFVGTLPTCLPVPCKDLVQDSKFTNTCAGKVTGDTCMVACATGYSLSGTASPYTCGMNSTFWGSPPVCLPDLCKTGQAEREADPLTS